MLRRLSLAAATMMVAVSPLFAQTESKPIVPTIPATQIEPRKVATPLEFTATASAANDFELKAAEQALAKATLPSVKDLAAMIKADHEKAGADIVAAAEADGVAVAPSSPDGEQIGMLGKLDAATGDDFDRLFVETQIYAHQRAIALFKGYAEGDLNLNRFAADTLPSLIKHYEMALAMAPDLKAVSAQ